MYEFEIASPFQLLFTAFYEFDSQKCNVNIRDWPKFSKYLVDRQ